MIYVISYQSDLLLSFPPSSPPPPPSLSLLPSFSLSLLLSLPPSFPLSLHLSLSFPLSLSPSLSLSFPLSLPFSLSFPLSPSLPLSPSTLTQTPTTADDVEGKLFSRAKSGDTEKSTADSLVSKTDIMSRFGFSRASS